jgi:hypothetical protein
VGGGGRNLEIGEGESRGLGDKAPDGALSGWSEGQGEGRRRSLRDRGRRRDAGTIARNSTGPGSREPVLRAERKASAAPP